jgi:hypothetical protein
LIPAVLSLEDLKARLERARLAQVRDNKAASHSEITASNRFHPGPERPPTRGFVPEGSKPVAPHRLRTNPQPSLVGPVSIQ